MLDGLIYVSGTIRVTYMEKIQVYLRKEELNAGELFTQRPRPIARPGSLAS